MARIPSVTSAQMAEIDRRMTEEFYVDLVLMMENAGRAVALHSRAMIGDLHALFSHRPCNVETGSGSYNQ